jgi:hypothetical protein
MDTFEGQLRQAAEPWIDRPDADVTVGRAAIRMTQKVVAQVRAGRVGQNQFPSRSCLFEP